MTTLLAIFGGIVVVLVIGKRLLDHWRGLALRREVLRVLADPGSYSIARAHAAWMLEQVRERHLRGEASMTEVEQTIAMYCLLRDQEQLLENESKQ
jgi:hypothetical protein